MALRSGHAATVVVSLKVRADCATLVEGVMVSGEHGTSERNRNLSKSYIVPRRVLG